jgi:hypothetical protein
MGRLRKELKMELNSKILGGVERLSRLRNIVLNHPRLVKIRNKIARLLESVRGVPARFGTATLTNAGVRFNNMTFSGQALTRLLRNTPRGRKVVIKWDPADAGSIAVWDPAAKHYVTLPNIEQNVCEGFSFWHVERLREYAERQHLDSSSEADLMKARDALRERWEKLATGKN